jgi:hypothetical protein
MIFDPVAVADALLAQFKVGDTVPPDIVNTLIGTRAPLPHDLFSVGQALLFERMNRVTALRTELLGRNILALSEEGALVLILPQHQVDRAFDIVKNKVDRVLRHGVNAVSRLDTTGLSNSLIAEQHDVAAHLDMLRRALNPASRKLKGQIETTEATITVMRRRAAP